jgi:AAA15 family ATPase/GTPase
MLISFRVENYLSFGQATELNVQATRELHHRARTFRSDIPGLRLLPISAIYGPNAAGKSNLFKALMFVRTLVIEGTEPEAETGAKPFRLAKAFLEQPSRFEVKFLAGQQAFAYRLALTSREVREESLSELLRTTERLVFSRRTGREESVFQFGSGVGVGEDEQPSQFLHFIGKGTRRNQLFLQQAREHEIKLLEPALGWFSRTLLMIAPSARPSFLVTSLLDREDFRDFCNDAIERIGVGIESLEAELLSPASLALSDIVGKTTLDEEGRERRITRKGRKYVAVKRDGKTNFAKLITLHRDRDNKPVRFELPDESDGTQRFIDLLPALNSLSREGGERVVFVDELDRSLHTNLLQIIIRSYLDDLDGKSHAQLLFTTHDVTLLDQDLFRRDEVILVQKNDLGETELNSLSDYAIRSDKRLMKDYLLGRYGAVPPMRSLRLRRAASPDKGRSAG